MLDIYNKQINESNNVIICDNQTEDECDYKTILKYSNIKHRNVWINKFNDTSIPFWKDTKAKTEHLYNNEKLHKQILLVCYLSSIVLITFGYLRDFLRNIGIERNKSNIECNREGYVPLYRGFDSFYTRNIFRRISDIWSKPVSGVPGALITVIDRESDDYNRSFRYSGTKTEVINMGSYNYLGFAENTGPITGQVLNTIEKYGMGLCTTGHELGTTDEILRLESKVAKFLGVESSVVFGMGFATNSTNLNTLVGKGCLVLSDELNHASIILGCRISGATIRTFRHNDMKDLEQILRNLLVFGQQRTHRRWNKVVIIVEGIYSMEANIVDLPELIRIKKQYKCYIYIDEAHSIGAIGSNGRGVYEYYDCDPNDIDLLMGTFTKSFGAAGGYIAGKGSIVRHIKSHSFGVAYANPMSPVIAQQISGVLSILMGEDGTNEGQSRIKRLARNTQYFRRKLNELGFIIYGNRDSPVVPIAISSFPNILAFIRMAYEKGIGLVAAVFPATSLTTGRIRLCISASHTKEMLDKTVKIMNEIGDKLEIKYSSSPRSKCEIKY